MKLDALREEWRRNLKNFHREGPTRVDPELIEDTLWFLDLLRKTQGYDIERPVRRPRERSYEDPYSHEETFKKYYEDAFKKYSADDIRRMEEEMARRFSGFRFEDIFGERFSRGKTYSGYNSAQPQQGNRPWHEVLGLSPNATIQQKQKAYRSLAMKFHPDRKGGSNEKMQELNQAKKDAGI